MDQVSYYEISLNNGEVVQVLYTATLGDLLIASVVAGVGVFLLIKSVVRTLWR